MHETATQPTELATKTPANRVVQTPPRERFPRDFPLARMDAGEVAHYVDDYRYQPGRTLCGRWLFADQLGTEFDLPLCRVCARRGDDYPTADEFRAYHACTECGVDTWALGEGCYTVRDSVWKTAYPLYRKGIGVGSTRPCIGCLEQRLGRPLTAADFILPAAHEIHGTGDRIERRFAGIPDEPRGSRKRRMMVRLLSLVRRCSRRSDDDPRNAQPTPERNPQ